MHLSVKPGRNARARRTTRTAVAPGLGGLGATAVVLPRCYRNELISIVSVRPGPTPIAEIGAPDISSSAFT